MDFPTQIVAARRDTAISHSSCSVWSWTDYFPDDRWTPDCSRVRPRGEWAADLKTVSRDWRPDSSAALQTFYTPRGVRDILQFRSPESWHERDNLSGVIKKIQTENHCKMQVVVLPHSVTSLGCTWPPRLNVFVNLYADYIFVNIITLSDIFIMLLWHCEQELNDLDMVITARKSCCIRIILRHDRHCEK